VSKVNDFFVKYPELISHFNQMKIHEIKMINLNNLKDALDLFNIIDPELVANFIKINPKEHNIFVNSETVENFDIIENNNLSHYEDIIIDDIENKFYEISKKNRHIKLKDILIDVNEFVEQKIISKDEIYDNLCKKYKVHSFNNRNFNILLDTYFKSERNEVYEATTKTKKLLLALKSKSKNLEKLSILKEIFLTIQNDLINHQEIEYDLISILIKNKINEKINSVGIPLDKYNLSQVFEDSIFYSYIKATKLSEDTQIRSFLKNILINLEIIQSINEMDKLSKLVLEENPNISIERVFSSKLGLKLNGFLSFEETANYIKLLLDNHDLYFELIKTLKYLTKDIKELLVENIDKLFMNSPNDDSNKYFNILLKRSEIPDYTLEELGREYNVTRERIRQIEKKLIDRFDKEITFKSAYQFELLISLLADSQYYLTRKELVEKLDNYGKVLYFLLKKSKKFSFEESLQTVFIKDSNWFVDLGHFIQNSQEQLTEDELRNLIKEISDYFESNGLNIDKRFIREVFLDSYNVKGDHYSKSRITEVVKFNKVLENYFNNGIHIYNNQELEKFREKYYLEYKDKSIFEKSDRSLVGIFYRFTYLVGKGHFNILDKAILKEKEVFENIKRYIDDNKQDIFFITGLYILYESELNQIGIFNRYHFQSNFKYYFSKDYFYKKDYIYKNKEVFGIGEEIYNYLNTSSKPLSIDEIRNHFQHLSSNVTYNHIINQENIILFGFDVYTTVNKVIMELEDVNLIKEIIELNLTESDFVSSDKLLFELHLHHSDLIEKYFIEDKHNLYAYVSNNLSKTFLYKRPFIFKLNIEPKNSEEILKGFVEIHKEISIESLKEYASETFIKMLDTFGFIKGLFPKYLWIDQDTIRVNDLELKEETIKEIRSLLEKLLINNDSIELSSINFQYFPSLKIKWTEYLLYSLVEILFSEKFKIETSSNQYNSVKFDLVMRWDK